jgi:hypothetical protein
MTIYAIIKRVLLRPHPGKDFNSIHAETELEKKFLLLTKQGIQSLDDPINKELRKIQCNTRINRHDLKSSTVVRHLFNAVYYKVNKI